MIAILATSNMKMDDVLFEVYSAISTVGMTTGITRDLNTVGRIIIIIMMYCGRIGSMTFVLSFVHRPDKANIELPRKSYHWIRIRRNEMKSILIIGMGKFGHHLCADLIKNGNDIMVMDKDEAKVRDLIYDVTKVQIGDCTDPQVVKALRNQQFRFDFCMYRHQFPELA